MSDITIDNIIIYLRKSRSDDPALSVEEVLAKHEADLQEYCEHEFGERIPEERIFREIVSGETIADRPVMRHVMQLLETGNYAGCLVIEPQRLSRGDLEDCGKIINTFRYTNTLVITPPKTYNLMDEYDRKFFEMELMRGNDYLEYTKKILRRGRERSVKEGNFIGSYAPYGYEKIKVGTGKSAYFTLRIVPEEAEIIKLIYHLFVQEGYGFARIARHLDRMNVKPKKSDYWSPPALKDMIENPVYIGKVRWNWRKTEKVMINGEIKKTRPKNKEQSDWIYVDGKHPAIIDTATYEAAMERRGKNPKITKGTELQNPFAGLLFCGSCGKAMSYRKYIDRRSNTGHVSRSMICNNQVNCNTKSVKYDAFLERVNETLEQTIADFEIKLNEENMNGNTVQNSMIKRLENELRKLHEKDMRQKDAFDDGIYTKQEYLSRNAKVQEQIAITTAALAGANATLNQRVDYENKILRFRNCLDALNNPEVSAAEKNILLKSCIDKIVYHNHMESKAGIGRFVENVFNIDIFLRS